MGRALYEGHAAIRQIYEEASTILGYDVAALCFDGPADRLNRTEYTQPALLTASIAAWRVVERIGLKPVALAGHSLGEYSGLVAGGAVSFPTAVGLVQKRGKYMSEAVPPGSGLVAAVLGLDADAVRDVCLEASVIGVVAAANFNSPGQIVIAGETAAVERALELAKAKGSRKAIRLPVSVPVHTPLMKTAAERLAQDLDGISWSDLTVPLVNNADAKPIRAASDVKGALVRQLPSPVLWEDSVKMMGSMGVTTFVEVGPGTVLTGLIKRILPAATTMSVSDPKSLDATWQALAGAQARTG